MNYPLTEALLGSCGGRHLDLGLVSGHGGVPRPRRAARRRRPSRPASSASSHLYDPAVTAVQLNLLGSHDTPRFVSVCGGDRAALRLATLLQMTLPGAPSIYYGDEIGMEGGLDPDNRRAFPTDPAAWDHELRAFVAGAIALRHSAATLRDRGLTRTVVATAGCHVHLRHDPEGGDAYLIAVNAGDEPARVELAVPELGGRGLDVVGWAGWPGPAVGPPRHDDAGRLWLEVPARDGLVLRAA